MDREGWERVQEVYHAALSSPEGEWPTFLDRACAGDSTLRREVEGLLVANGRAQSFLSPEELGSHLEELQSDDEPKPAGTLLDHYQIVSLIGRGGMGEVYLALDTRLG